MPSTPGDKAVSRLAAWQVGTVDRFIDAHLASEIRIVQLAGIARLTRSHFSRAFLRTRGESPSVYLRRRRLERAQQLMLTTGLSLAQIALDCGFADQCHFTHAFKRVVGATPGNWRRARLPQD